MGKRRDVVNSREGRTGRGMARNGVGCGGGRGIRQENADFGCDNRR